MSRGLTNNWPSKRAPLLIVVGFTAVMAWLVLVPHRFLCLNWDEGFYLYAAKLFVAGKIPYVDFIDNNPPLALYLHAPAAALSLWTGIASYRIFFAFVLALLVFSAKVLWAALAPFDSRSRKLVLIGYFAVSLVIALQSSFGEREYLFALVFLPYLFLRCSGRPIRAPSEWVFVFLCGLLFCLKPNFMGMALLLELCFLKLFPRPRSRSAILVFLSGPVLYLLSFLLLPREANRAFWFSLVPLMLSGYRNFGFQLKYWYASDQGYLLLAILGTAFPVLLWVGFRKISSAQKPAAEALVLLAFSGIVATLVLLLQNKGSDYQFIPCIACLVPGALIAVGLMERPALIIASAVLTTVWIYPFIANLYFCNPFLSPSVFEGPQERLFLTVRELTPPGETMIVFSAFPWEAYYLLNDIGYASRYSITFPVLFGYFPGTGGADSRMSPGAWKYVADTREDILEKRPRALIFARDQHMLPFFNEDLDYYVFAKRYILTGEIAQRYTPLFSNFEEDVLLRKDALSDAREQLKKEPLHTIAIIPEISGFAGDWVW